MAYVPQYPTRYALRIPPTVILNERPKNDVVVRAVDSSIFAAPPLDEPRSTREATPLVRVFMEAYLHLKSGHRATLSGPLKQKKLIDNWDTPNGHYTTLGKHVSRISIPRGYAHECRRSPSDMPVALSCIIGSTAKSTLKLTSF